jgi:hypothetical protein
MDVSREELAVIGECLEAGASLHQNPKSSCPGIDQKWEQTCSNLPKRRRTYAFTKTDFDLQPCVIIALVSFRWAGIQRAGSPRNAGARAYEPSALRPNHRRVPMTAIGTDIDIA